MPQYSAPHPTERGAILTAEKPNLVILYERAFEKHFAFDSMEDAARFAEKEHTPDKDPGRERRSLICIFQDSVWKVVRNRSS